jgi:ketosteroid isomerase-like protein
MKTIFLFAAIFLTFALTIQAQSAPDAAELTKMLKEFLAGAGRNDAAIHDRFWAEDLIYTRSAGARINKEELMKGVRSAPAPKPGDPVTVYTAEDVRIQQYGDAAILAFRLVSTTTKSDGTKTVGNNLNTGTFVKRNGKWQVVAWQSTVVPDPKAASLTSAATASTAKSSATSTKSAATRVYHRGSRGGCYYLNSKGNKVYVDRSLCK